MKSVIFKLIAFLQYQRSAVNEHSIHSPFVFDLLTKVIQSKKHFYAFNEIAHIKKQLKKSSESITQIEFRAGSHKLVVLFFAFLFFSNCMKKHSFIELLTSETSKGLTRTNFINGLNKLDEKSFHQCFNEYIHIKEEFNHNSFLNLVPVYQGCGDSECIERFVDLVIFESKSEWLEISKNPDTVSNLLIDEKNFDFYHEEAPFSIFEAFNEVAIKMHKIKSLNNVEYKKAKVLSAAELRKFYPMSAALSDRMIKDDRYQNFSGEFNVPDDFFKPKNKN